MTGRPALHFTARRGWINDPHGVTFRNGLYHLFYQCVPDDVRWRPGITWGHATSADLLWWPEGPPALLPGGGDAGCWSGSVCGSPPGVPPAMYYTSVDAGDLDHGAVRIARPLDDDWTAWSKGPVLLRTPEQ